MKIPAVHLIATRKNNELLDFRLSKPSDVLGKAQHAPGLNPMRIVVGDATHDFPEPLVVRLRQQRRRQAGDRIDQIIMAARRVIDAVFAAARSATFECGELRNEPGIVEQFDALRVH